MSNNESAARPTRRTQEDPATRLQKTYTNGEPDLRIASEIIADSFGLKTIDLSSVEIPEGIKDYLRKDICKKYNCVPFALNGKTIKIALSDPANIEIADIFPKILDENIEYFYAPSRDIDIVIEKVYDNRNLVQEASESFDAIEKITIEQFVENDDAVGPSVNFVNLLFKQALQDRASDIYIEQNASNASIRFRIDGVCHSMPSPPKNSLAQVLSRIKVLAKIDITERRESQDGRFTILVNSKPVDMRVSTFPSVCGETLTIRILDKSKTMLSINSLGMQDSQSDLFSRFLVSQYGLCLVSGPTGSGKTTTLYAGLQEINTEYTKIITIENPVEYQIDGLTQCSIDGHKTTFVSGLRAALRQAPDVIMVGEIRDSETADIATKAALTGHLVMSTIHTNDATSTPHRLKSMGVQDFALESALHTIIAQRLIKKLCPSCKKENESVGCKNCLHTGYYGRLAVYEILALDNKVKKELMFSAGLNFRKTLIDNHDFLTMYDDGKIKFEKGLISNQGLASLVDFRG